MKRLAIIDRFESDKVVLELDNRQMLTIQRSDITGQAHEGDVVWSDGSCWQVDPEATRKRRQEIDKLIQEI